MAQGYLKRISIAFFSNLPALHSYGTPCGTHRIHYNRGYFFIVRFFLQRRQGVGANCIRQHHVYLLRIVARPCKPAIGG